MTGYEIVREAMRKHPQDIGAARAYALKRIKGNELLLNVELDRILDLYVSRVIYDIRHESHRRLKGLPERATTRPTKRDAATMDAVTIESETWMNYSMPIGKRLGDCNGAELDYCIAVATSQRDGIDRNILLWKQLRSKLKGDAVVGDAFSADDLERINGNISRTLAKAS